MMKRLLLFAAFAAFAFGQGTTCSQPGTFTSATTGTALDNRLPVTRTAACDAWRLDYFSTGLSALSISVQGAPDSNGVPGTWVDVPSTAITQGSNPSTTLQGTILMRTYYPWMRVNVGTFTTTGSITYALFGVNANSVNPPVTATISGTSAVTQSGTWTMQPGNTANTTPWLMTIAQGGNSATVSAGGALKVDGSAATQPVSGTVTATPTGTYDQNLKQFGGTTITFDPCFARAKTIVPFSTTASTRIVTGTASNKTYICSFVIVEGAATNTALVEGTGSTCGTSTVGLAGGTTAATGLNFAANGGAVMGSGIGTVAVTTVNANDVCLLLSAANQTSGVIGYVTAP